MYSYIQVLPNQFILKSDVIKLMLRPKSEAGHTLRSNMYNIRTNRFQSSFVPAMCWGLVRYILLSILFRWN